MGLTSYVRSVLNSAVSPYGYELIQSSKLHDLKERFGTLPRYTSSPLPEGASNYLCHRNPQLEALRNRYSAFDKSVTHPLVWKDTHVQPDDILYFRGDNAYVWQLKGQNMTDTAYGLTAYYVKSIDTLGLLSQLQEDSFFGSFTFDIDSKLISRDLLDSIVEIYFLEKHLNISRTKNLTILDIGAGYGRLAHRMIRAFPNIQNYLCTDGVAVSSFIAEYYLQFRSLDSKAKSVPLDEIDSVLNDLNIELAVNIHSFSECTLSAIDWWLALLKKHCVRYLMIAPNSLRSGGTQLRTNFNQDFGKLIEKHGYKLLAKEPKYRDPFVQKYAINPTYHYLFELD